MAAVTAVRSADRLLRPHRPRVLRRFDVAVVPLAGRRTGSDPFRASSWAIGVDHLISDGVDGPGGTLRQYAFVWRLRRRPASSSSIAASVAQ